LSQQNAARRHFCDSLGYEQQRIMLVLNVPGQVFSIQAGGCGSSRRLLDSFQLSSLIDRRRDFRFDAPRC
jgi:hypothetical protein